MNNHSRLSPSYPKLIQPPPLYRYLHCSFYISICSQVIHLNPLDIHVIAFIIRLPHQISIYAQYWQHQVIISSFYEMYHVCNKKVGIHEKQLLDHTRSLYVQLMHLIHLTTWYKWPKQDDISYPPLFPVINGFIHADISVYMCIWECFCVANQQWKWNVWV